MNAFILHGTTEETGILRWGTSATAMVAVHAALVALVMAWYTQRPAPGVTMPAVMVAARACETGDGAGADRADTAAGKARC